MNGQLTLVHSVSSIRTKAAQGTTNIRKGPLNRLWSLPKVKCWYKRPIS